MSTLPLLAIRRQIIALIPVYMNVYMVGCTAGWIPNAIYFLLAGREVSGTPTQCSFIASCNEFGRITFALPAGILADKYGRKIIIMSAGFIYFFSWLLLSVDASIIVILTARFSLGVATALSNATALISIGEISSPEVRGRLTSLYLIFLNSGIITPSIISVLFSSYHILSYGIAFLSSLCFISMFFIMETPSYLISISNYDQAMVNLKRIRLGISENEIDNEFDKLRKYIDDEKARKSQVSWLTFMKSAAIRKPLLTAILLNYFSMSVGLTVISAYVTAIYPRNEFVDKKFFPLIIQVIMLFIAISTTFYIEILPRRTIFMIGAALTAISTAFCALMNFYYVEYQYDLFKWIFLIGNVLTSIIIAGSVQPMNSAIKSELFPQAVKGFGGSLGVIAQATSAIVSYQLYNLITENFGLYYMYVIFSMNSIILCLLVYHLLPEGRGRYLADVQMEFKDKVCGTDFHENDNLEGKFVLGITTALTNATSLVCIGEIASPAIRGRFIGFYQTSLAMGLLSQCILSVLFSSYNSLSYGTNALSFPFFISMYWIMEIPDYLISKSKSHQAKEGLKNIRIGYSENDIILEF